MTVVLTVKYEGAMKRISFVFGAAMAAIFALTSCNKEISNPDEIIKDGIPFEISAASADTKTSNNGLSTNWVAGDKLNLFHAEAGSTTYTSDGSFSISKEDLESKTFKGTLASELGEGNYDWYALYPYNQNVSTPANTGTKGYVTVGGTSQTQEGNSSTAHLCDKVCPLYGVAKSVASSATPGITMNHLTSIIEVNVTNNSGADLTVSNVSFTGTEDIVGTYYIDFTGETVAYTSSGANYVSKTASLTVNNGTAIANKGSATFYIAIKPFKADSGKTLTVSVNGYDKEINLTKDVTFTAGLIKTINFNYDVALSNSLTDGSYIIAVKDGDKYYAMTSSPKGTSDRRDYSEIGYNGSGSYETTNSSIVWSIENTQTGITISNKGKYIIAAKNVAKLGEKSSASVISFASQSDGSYWFSYYLGQTDGTRYLAKNENNGFGFYASTTGIKNIMLIPADFNAIPAIVVEKSSISVASTGGPANLSYQILNPIDGKTITAVSNSTWVNNISTSVEGEITFSVDENSGAAREATLTISYEGATNVTVTVQQKAAGTGSELKTWTYALSSTSGPKLNADNPATVNGATWSITMGDKAGSPSTNGTPTAAYKQVGWKWGNNSDNYWKSYTLSTDYFASKSVKSVTVNFLNNGKKSATMIVKQGEITIGTATQEFGTTWTDLKAESTQGTGGTLTINYAVAQASYIHSITVEYYD